MMRTSFDSINDRKIYSSNKKDLNHHTKLSSTKRNTKNVFSTSRESISNFETTFQSPSSINDRKILSPSSQNHIQYLTNKKEDIMKRITSQAYKDKNFTNSAFSPSLNIQSHDFKNSTKIQAFSCEPSVEGRNIEYIIAQSIRQSPQGFSVEIFQSLLKDCGFMTSSNEQLWEQLWRILQYSLQSDIVSSSLVNQILLLLINSQISRDQKVQEITSILKSTFEQMSSSSIDDFDKELNHLGMNIDSLIYQLSQSLESNEDALTSQSVQQNKDNVITQLLNDASPLSRAVANINDSRNNITNSREEQIREDLEEFGKDISEISKQSYTVQQSKHYEQKELAQNLISNQNAHKYSTENKQPSSQNRHEMLFKHAQLLHQKKNAVSLLKEKEELEKCTFQPILKTPTSQQQKIKIYSQKEVHSRLHEQATELKEKNDLKRKSINLKQEQEQEQFTFQPQINKSFNFGRNNQDVISLVPGVKNAIDRFQKARQIKSEKELFYEKKLEACRLKEIKSHMTKVQEFSFLCRKDPLKKEPIMFLDVNINAGKKGRIALHQGDDSKKVANNFAKIYQLTEEAEKELEDRIEDAFNIYYSQEDQ